LTWATASQAVDMLLAMAVSLVKILPLHWTCTIPDAIRIIYVVDAHQIKTDTWSYKQSLLAKHDLERQEQLVSIKELTPQLTPRTGTLVVEERSETVTGPLQSQQT
jgi:hypothetical protein